MHDPLALYLKTDRLPGYLSQGAVPTGFEPAISALTGPCVRPTTPRDQGVLYNAENNRGGPGRIRTSVAVTAPDLQSGGFDRSPTDP